MWRAKQSYYGEAWECENDCPTQPRLYMSSHGRRRGAQRNLSAESLHYILTFGHEYQRTGVSFYVLRRCDIPPEDLRSAERARLVGAIALVTSDGVLITVYRNPAAIRAICRKMKYRIPWKEATRYNETEYAQE